MGELVFMSKIQEDRTVIRSLKEPRGRAPIAKAHNAILRYHSSKGKIVSERLKQLGGARNAMVLVLDNSAITPKSLCDQA